MFSKTINLSTLHLTEKTLELLSEEAMHEQAQFEAGKEMRFLTAFYKNDEGFIIIVNKDKFQNALQNDEEIPFDLVAVISFALVNDCTMICVADGEDVLACLPTYEYMYDQDPDGDTTIMNIILGGKVIGSEKIESHY